MLRRLALILPLLAAIAAAAPPPELTLERIMADPEWMGRFPESPRWSVDGNSVLFDRKMAGCDEREVVELSLIDRSERIVPDDRRGAVDAWTGILSPDVRFMASIRAGDVFVTELANGRTRQLTRTHHAEEDPFFLADGRSVAFRRGGDVVARDIASGLEWQPFDVRTEDDPGRTPEATFLRDQQARLFDHLRESRTEADDQRQREKERRLADSTRAPPPWYLGKDTKIHESALSPSGRFLIVRLGGRTDDDWKKGLMPRWVTDSGEIETREVHPKVGAGKIETQRLVLLDLERHERHALDLSILPGIEDDPLDDLRRLAEERVAALKKRSARDAEVRGEDPIPQDGGKDEAKADAKPKGRKQPRAVSIGRIEWNRPGTHVAVQFRAADNKDRWIATIDLAKHALVPLHREHDEAWVSWDSGAFGWLGDGETLWFLSEETGFTHISIRRMGEKAARRLTSGRQVVGSVVPTRDGTSLYFVANPGNPGIHEVHRVEVATGRAEQVSRLGGRNAFVMSPDESKLLVSHSDATHPPELWIQDSAPGGLARRITDSRSPDFAAIAWAAPRFVDIPSRHGAGSIRARLILPDDSPDGGRPAVIFIHGAGYLQDAHEGWSSYSREFMFATLLARRGYVVLDLDYRGSAGYGRAWRTAIHRDMGGPELEDLADAIGWLATRHGVDRARVGAFGGSYGGFLVLMTMFRQPELLACGAALRPVTDWAHYNHGYTSNILETPDLAPDAYRRSSPIEWASGLSRPLLICAPMQDDNVFFQDTVRLAQRLIELEKQDWEVAIYPVEPHGFRHPSSWLDEYRRILKLFERYL